MQISTNNGDGTVQITNGEARVIASAGVSWADVLEAVTDGDAELSIVGSSRVPYSIANVYEPGHAGNTTVDRWELVIVGVVYEDTAAAAEYAISIDWIPIGEDFLWDPQLKDTQTLQYLKRNFRVIAANINRGLPKQQALPIAAAGDFASTQSTGIHSIKSIVAAGAGGAYTANVLLAASGRAAGDRCNIRFEVAASANPKIRVYNDTSAGTKLFEWQADGNATAIAATFVFDGAAWYLENAQFIQ